MGRCKRKHGRHYAFHPRQVEKCSATLTYGNVYYRCCDNFAWRQCTNVSRFGARIFSHPSTNPMPTQYALQCNFCTGWTRKSMGGNDRRGRKQNLSSWQSISSITSFSNERERNLIVIHHRVDFLIFTRITVKFLLPLKCFHESYFYSIRNFHRAWCNCFFNS